jgi:hypothetical protein
MGSAETFPTKRVKSYFLRVDRGRCGGLHNNQIEIMKKTLLVAVGIIASTLSLHADTLFSDTFTGYTDGDLVGQGGWVITGTSTLLPIQVAPGLVTLQQGSAQDANHPFSPITSGSLYYALTATYTSKNATADYAFHMSDGGTSSFGARISAKAGATAGTFVLAWQGGSTAPVTFGAELNLNTAYYIVLRYNIVDGATNDTGALYVSTTPFGTTEGDYTPYQDATAWTGGTEVATFQAFNLRQGTNSGGETLNSVAVGTTWGDAVSPVPEPGTVALVGLGLGAVLLGARRRRRA